MPRPTAQRTVDVPGELDLLRSFGVLVSSHLDPTIRLRRDRMLRTSWTPDGAGTVLVERHGPRRFHVEAWGPGSAWLLEQSPDLLGCRDDPSQLDPTGHPAVARAAHRRPGLRLIRTGAVADLLVPTILAQRVTSHEAARSWTRIVRRYGHPAPGPYPLRLPPRLTELATLPSWDLHRLGVEADRARKIATACRAHDRLQQAVGLPRERALASFTALPGIGPWTAALVLRTAAGDPDLVEVGDYHVKNHVAWHLAGEARATDERMLELLAPFQGQRGRVVRLLLSAGSRPPSFGARHRIVPIETL